MKIARGRTKDFKNAANSAEEVIKQPAILLEDLGKSGCHYKLGESLVMLKEIRYKSEHNETGIFI
ncbi:hypothetical protein [Mesobacillus zeae]|uniref:Uncharacterized protein n=1 Tax=Mesobacillus zeae TaxID=1917180 RepID=A0A398BKI9_9BACI|nr:hypothetical protein [Mesobacillus zeae]RID88270.1 hypothetical protein D1970_01850 [Mesobacillus zeae]